MDNPVRAAHPAKPAAVTAQTGFHASWIELSRL